MKDVINDLFGFQLSLIGALVSVLTLLYTLYNDKKEEYENIQNVKDDLVLRVRKISLSNRISPLKVILKRVGTIFVIICLLFIFSIAVKYFINPDNCIWLYIDLSLTILLVFWFIYSMYKFFRSNKQL